jgi:hypothetical protein
MIRRLDMPENRTVRTRRGTGGQAAAALDRGIAITGELRIKLLGVSLLPIEVRLLISSSDLAQALGVAWWPQQERVASRQASRRTSADNAAGAANAARHARRNGSAGGSRRSNASRRNKSTSRSTG